MRAASRLRARYADAVTAPRPVPHDDPDAAARLVVVARHDGDDVVSPRRRAVTHTYATLVFVTDGSLRVEQNGVFRVGVGDALLVPAGAPHRMLERVRPAYWGVSFCAPCVAADGAAVLLAPFERVRDGASPVVRVPGARRGHLEGLLRELADVGRASRRAGDAHDFVQRSLLALILHEVDRAAGAGDGGERPGRSVVVDSLRFIERNCLRPLTLHEVAAAVGRSRAYVTTALTQATGRSAVDWIVAGRMAEARRLLLHSDEHVDVVAERVGYADATHFIRMFRRAHGTTPGAWRAAQTRVTARRPDPSSAPG